MLRHLFKLGSSTSCNANFRTIVYHKSSKFNIRRSNIPVVSAVHISSTRSFSSSPNQNAMHKVLFVNAASPDNEIPDPVAPHFIEQSSNIGSISSEGVEYIPPPPSPIEVIDGTPPELLNALGEPTFASLGLGGYWPSGLMETSLEFLHVSTGLPWWSTIAIATVVIRTLVFPVVIKSQRQMAVMQECMPQMQLLNSQMSDARRRGNNLEAAQISQELQTFMKTKDYNPLKTAMLPLLQAPIFISMFFALRSCANLPVESLKTGGIFWFTDLTLSDPYFLLPILTSVTMLATIELGAEMGAQANQSKMIRYVMRGLPILVFPFIMNFPTAILCYWVATNFFSLLQVGFLGIPKVRKYFNIKQHVKHDIEKLPISKKSFKESVTETWTNMKVQGELRERSRLDQVRFKKSGLGPMVKTYKTDPTLGIRNKSNVINVKGVEKGR